MALERFIPKSPDANIRNTQDFEVAKFGHLNTIVEYINNNSAKPAGLNGYVQFNDNSALGGDAGLFWDNVNKRLGVGTVTPAYQLTLSNQLYTQKGAYLAIDGATTSSVNNFVGIGTTTPTAILHLVYTYGQVVRNQRVGDSLNGAPTYENFKSGGVPGALTAVLANTNLGQYTWRGSTGATTNGLGARLQVWSLENFTTSAFGSRLDLSVTQLGTTTEVVMMNLRGTGVNIGNTTNDLGARLGVRGSGSTSATTSLLVQNSSGATALNINDATNVLIGTTTDNGYKLNVNGSINIAGGNKLNFSNGSAQCWITNEGLTGLGSRSILIPGTEGGGGFVFYSDAGGPITTFDASGDSLSIRAGSSAVTAIMTINKSAASGYGGGSFIYYQTTYGNRMYTFGNPINERGDESGSHTKVAAGQAGFLGNGGHVYLESGAKGTQVGSVDGNIIIGETRGNVGVGTATMSAKFQVKGSGSTSATTSLLVQNSSGTDLFKVRDDGQINLNGTLLNNNFNSGQITISNSGQGNILLSTSNSQLNYNGNFKFGFNNNAASARVQIDSITQGFLPPRMTTAQKNAITTPAAGLMVYDTDLNKLCVYTTTWETITSA